MVIRILSFCILACSCFGQAYTFMDPAFMLRIANPPPPVNITNGLVAYWKMNEGISTNLFDSWGTNTLTFRTPQPVWSTNGYPGITNVYFHTNKAGAVAAQINTNFNLGTNDFSITAWFRPTNSSWNRIVWAIDQIRSASFFALKTEALPTTPYLCLTAPDSVDNGVIVQGPEVGSIRNNTWHFVAASRRGTNYFLSLDGTNFWARSTTNQISLSTIDYANPVAVIGEAPAISGQSAGFLGQIEEVAIRIGYGLTTNDVLYLYNTYYGGPPQSYVSPYPNITNMLTLYLKMDEGRGDDLIDSSTNALNASIFPGSWTDKGHNHTYAYNCAIGGAGTARSEKYFFQTNADYSVGMWICHTNSSWSDEFLMFPAYYDHPELKYTTVGGNDAFGYFPYPGGTYQLYGGNRGMYDNVWSFIVITRRNLEHIWYRCTGGQIYTYTNSFGEGTYVGESLFQSYGLGVGPDNLNWKGYMEEFRIHNGYCLSSNEVWYLYNRYYSP